MADTNDKPYKSPPASVDNDSTPWGPFHRGKIPPDDYHTCPCCNGYGFVGIVDEEKVPLIRQDLVDDSGV